jgi:hypothetical protein
VRVVQASTHPNGQRRFNSFVPLKFRKDSVVLGLSAMLIGGLSVPYVFLQNCRDLFDAPQQIFRSHGSAFNRDDRMNSGWPSNCAKFNSRNRDAGGNHFDKGGTFFTLSCLAKYGRKSA